MGDTWNEVIDVSLPDDNGDLTLSHNTETGAAILSIGDVGIELDECDERVIMAWLESRRCC